MKKLLLILFSFFAITVSVNAKLVSKNVEIVLTSNDEDRELSNKTANTSSEDAPQVRSGIFSPVYAYLCNKEVSVYFESIFSVVKVSIIDEVSGETIHSELLNYPTSFTIDLNRENTGDYMIEIVSDEISLEGFFSL